MFWIWLGIIIVLTLLELSTKNLIMIFFVASAIISLISSIFVDEFIIQFLIFVVLGTLLLVTVRDKLIKFINDKKATSKKNSPNKTKVKNEK
ncbi:MAG: hypothetical protein IJY25_06190 [Bacilli bacterium]|nr:hypothetical protein [Bacilli bacterium]